MTDKEREEFAQLKAQVDLLSNRLSNVEGANAVLNDRILRTLDQARKRNLLPAV